jgi:hypothetical protein
VGPSDVCVRTLVGVRLWDQKGVVVMISRVEISDSCMFALRQRDMFVPRALDDGQRY